MPVPAAEQVNRGIGGNHHGSGMWSGDTGMTDRKPGMLSILADIQKQASEASKEGDVGNPAGGSPKQASAPLKVASQTANESLGQGTRTASVADAVQADAGATPAPGLSKKKPQKGEATKPASTPISTGRVGRPPNPESEKKVCGNCGLRKAWRRGLCRVCFVDDAPKGERKEIKYLALDYCI